MTREQQSAMWKHVFDNAVRVGEPQAKAVEEADAALAAYFQRFPEERPETTTPPPASPS